MHRKRTVTISPKLKAFNRLWQKQQMCCYVLYFLHSPKIKFHYTWKYIWIWFLFWFYGKKQFLFSLIFFFNQSRIKEGKRNKSKASKENTNVWNCSHCQCLAKITQNLKDSIECSATYPINHSTVSRRYSGSRSSLTAVLFNLSNYEIFSLVRE